MNILLIGSPNSGKTTLFNRLTGLRAKAVNYPGSTVELLEGEWMGATVTDAPGIYSFEARTLDEDVTVRELKANAGSKNPKLVLFVLDSTQVGRHSHLALKLVRAKIPCLVIVTMTDLLRREGLTVDLERLSLEVGARCFDSNAADFETNLKAAVTAMKAKLASDAALSQSETLADTVIQTLSETSDDLWDQARKIEAEVLRPLHDAAASRHSPREQTRRLDRVALHPVWGVLVFLGLMSALFISIYWVASPMMEWVDHGFGWVADSLLNLSPDSVAVRFLAQGVVTGFGAVLVFVPQIFILFIGIIALEDSGYLARAATIVDRPLRALGLGGRSFVPLLSGFACAVPAMLAARTVGSRRERLMTLFILPLMSCSARLPVYALLLGFLFPHSAILAGVSLAGLYFLSILSGAVASILATKLGVFEKALKGESSFLVLELPIYRSPKPMLVLKQALLRTKTYVKRAGLVILALSVVIWVGSTFPNYEEKEASVRLETSYLGRAGRVLTPIFEPMGGDWRTGIGLLSAFAAREVFVSTLAVVFHVTDSEEAGVQTGLIDQMQKAKTEDGRSLFTPASVAGLLIFFVIALQCLSTFSIAGKESGSWKFAWAQLIAFNVVAYVLSVAVVQGLRLLGVA